MVYFTQGSLIHKEREAELLTSSGKIQGVPDLVVEVISPSTRARDTVHKMRIYHEAGVPWYWLIDSETLTIHEYQHTQEGYLLRIAADAGEVSILRQWRGSRSISDNLLESRKVSEEKVCSALIIPKKSLLSCTRALKGQESSPHDITLNLCLFHRSSY